MKSRIIFASSLLLLSVVSCKEEAPKPAPAVPSAAPSAAPAVVEIDPATLTMFAQLPKEMTSDANPITDAKVELGRMLYFEKRVSKNQDLSCNTCHHLDGFGVDGQDVSTGHKGQKGTRNSPSVYNAAGQFVQFWDGRAPTVEKQAEGPVLNPVEMAMPNEKGVLAVLSSMPEYVEAFKKAFPDDKPPLTYENFGKAIGAFERRLVTPARFDKFLAGDKSALNEDEKKGLKLFMDSGCTACHSGAYVGGATFQKLGAVKPWPNQKDQGRAEVTKQDADKMSFKVAILRNIAKTAPYFHDASAKTLDQAISMMAEHQLGKSLSASDVAAITAFLGSLTGEVPADYVKEPVLPKSTPKTPKPDPN